MSRPVVLSITRMKGHQVVNAAGEKLGYVDDLVIDDVSGQILYGIVSHGGVLGAGQRRTPAPWDALRFDSSKNEFFLNMDKETLRSAPHLDESHWPDMSDPNWQASIASYFDFNPAEEPNEPALTDEERRRRIREQRISSRAPDVAEQRRRTTTVGKPYLEEPAEEFIDDSSHSMSKTTLPDARLAAQIEDELQSGDGLLFRRVRVTVKSGIATLMGEVVSAEHSRLAAQSARQVEGVRDVVNKLRVSRVA